MTWRSRMSEEKLAEMNARPVTTSCLFCDWVHEGTLGEGRRLNLEHRKKEHPERVVKKRVRAGRHSYDKAVVTRGVLS